MLIQSALRAAACACLVVYVGVASAPVLAECDTSFPQLVNFDFSPAAVDVTSGPAGVTCNMTLTDTLTGVGGTLCLFRAPGVTQSLACTADTPSAGDRNNGTFSCTIDVPPNVESGVWKAWIEAVDLAGNLILVTDFELEFIYMLSASLDVTSDPDIDAPTLTAFDFNPKTTDVSAGPVNVTCSMTLTDALAGVSRASCFLADPIDGSGYACIALAPLSGDRNDGTFSCDVTVPRYAQEGAWTANVFAWDGVENFVAIDAPLLQGMGFPTDLTIASSPIDSTAPVLTGFDFTPKSVDTSAAPAVVGCTVDVTDNLSGVDNIVCGFNSPSFLQGQSCTALTPVSGTSSNGTYQCSVVIPQSPEGGAWKAAVEVYDGVGNALQADSTTLATSGFPTDLDVDCGGTPSPGFSLGFSSKTGFTWAPLPDAFLYYVYRGDVSGLIADYGTCQNANDPDPTDTMYDDSEDPLPGQGFHYLVSYLSIFGETGLGATSNGVPRVVQTPCP